MGKLSHNLLDLGYFCALGTSEHPGFRDEEIHVKRGMPFTFDGNNGITVVYDEEGRPWIILTRDLMNDSRKGTQAQDEISKYDLKQGAYVPHSNDGGHFVRSVLPTL